ncbi:hypothetical protein PC118_g13127 [Phytophthora cactorum]|uniref:Uncharacterized protein n=1 Tax=Phytophthora cactorum TaxID=29920 RepID=A0A8T1FJS1_9STRA|nr:hypothetical protein PC112_g13116 [Phytophthora cactorum]KAG2830360.1 hypothetical protein PC111_g7424 [Phytophthora cactorum]KAG2898683.1 hypothetical protein PC114_g14199 [Phytophthora cactorum]KAG2976996.1 hypothetical protein PC118_g13127 [Phytophthora cactorum]KAG3010053.1 hypothetical protein PC119_g13691 [Phytophthora cactorum]
MTRSGLVDLLFAAQVQPHGKKPSTAQDHTSHRSSPVKTGFSKAAANNRLLDSTPPNLLRTLDRSTSKYQRIHIKDDFYERIDPGREINVLNIPLEKLWWETSDWISC